MLENAYFFQYRKNLTKINFLNHQILDTNLLNIINIFTIDIEIISKKNKKKDNF